MATEGYSRTESGRSLVDFPDDNLTASFKRTITDGQRAILTEMKKTENGKKERETLFQEFLRS